MLLPKKWNPRKQGQVYSWRFDPREFGAACDAPDYRRPASAHDPTAAQHDSACAGHVPHAHI